MVEKQTPPQLSSESFNLLYGHADGLLNWTQRLVDEGFATEEEREKTVLEKAQEYIHKFGPNILERLRPEYQEAWNKFNNQLDSPET
jgi:hypothetical protein